MGVARHQLPSAGPSQPRAWTRLQTPPQPVEPAQAPGGAVEGGGRAWPGSRPALRHGRLGSRTILRWQRRSRVWRLAGRGQRGVHERGPGSWAVGPGLTRTHMGSHGSYSPHGSRMLSKSQSLPEEWGGGSRVGPMGFSEKQGASASPDTPGLPQLFILGTQDPAHTETPQKGSRGQAEPGLGPRHTGAPAPQGPQSLCTCPTGTQRGGGQHVAQAVSTHPTHTHHTHTHYPHTFTPTQTQTTHSLPHTHPHTYTHTPTHTHPHTHSHTPTHIHTHTHPHTHSPSPHSHPPHSHHTPTATHTHSQTHSPTTHMHSPTTHSGHTLTHTHPLS